MRFALAFACLLVQLSAASFSCETNVPAPAYIRPEGITELLADIALTCTGTVPPTGIRADMDLYFNTQIGGSTSEGLPMLLIGDGQNGWKLGQNAIAGSYPSPSVVHWGSVLLAVGGVQGPFHFRFANLRTNASSLGAPTGQSHSLIFCTLTINGVEVHSPVRLVAVLTPHTLIGRLTACNGRDAADQEFSQATPTNTGLMADDGVGGTMQFAVRFAESFERAFKPLVSARQYPVEGFAEAATESPEFRDVPGIRGATYGTRLLVNFSNIPAGVDLYVTTEQMLPGLGTSDSVHAKLVGFMSSGDGPEEKLGDVKTARCGAVDLAVARVPLNDGSGSAVWEITAANPNTVEEISFGVAVAFRSDLKANTPGLGTGVISGSLAPLSTMLGNAKGAPVPRFVPSSTAQNFFTINRPVTKLLFPFVTNSVGFDTTLVLTNTSDVPGRCVLNFSGDLNHSSPPPMDLDKSFAPKTPVKLQLGEVAPGFQGCVLATCFVTSAQGTFGVVAPFKMQSEISGQAFAPTAMSFEALDKLDNQTHGLARTCQFLAKKQSARLP